ncbi:transcription-repair coupling factor [Lentisphaerota bacterium WC36G]|nr:transcription-repair coupling factor [Lentisphaerae bacterium WC36]
MNFKNLITNFISGYKLICDNFKLSNVDIDFAALLIINLIEKKIKKNSILITENSSIADELFVLCKLFLDEFQFDYKIILLPEISNGNNKIPQFLDNYINAVDYAKNGNYDLIIGSCSAFLDPSIALEKISDNELEINLNNLQLTYSYIIDKLVDFDYDDEFEVKTTGEFSRRGGIIDIFSVCEEHPVRLEFFDEELESIRSFDAKTQFSTGSLENYKIIRRNIFDNEITLENNAQKNLNTQDFLELLNLENTAITIFHPERCTATVANFLSEQKANRYKNILENNNIQKILLCDDIEADTFKNIPFCGIYSTANQFSLTSKQILGLKKNQDALSEIKKLNSNQLQNITGQQIEQWLRINYQIFIVSNSQKHENHHIIKEWFKQRNLPLNKVFFIDSNIVHGFVIPSINTVILTEKEIFTGQKSNHHLLMTEEHTEQQDTYNFETKKITEQNQTYPENTIDSTVYADLDAGDYAIHLEHGLCKYHGINELKTDDYVREVLVLEFADEKMLYVPIIQAGVVSRYIPSAKGSVKLHTLGGSKWNKDKVSVVNNIKSFAIDMLKTQATRESHEGFAFEDHELERQIFIDSFPYNDTPDQTKATFEVLEDMTKTTPMDRLICGDVGYGKTEVAIRAAFTAVMNGKQVAVLVPTTVLAQQHFLSFKERFAEHGVLIDLLNRFRSKAEQKQIIHDIREHKVDIIIGTHRLVQKDVFFKDLGLVIIDEEQRFGVKAKENLKKLRANVDVLTMTATPIPRTLYMSLSGARDLSTIVTAPGKRLPVKTIITQYNNEIVDEAINNEVKRGGQVFYLHNRVKTIDKVCANLQKRNPHIRFIVAHGQMHENNLEDVMQTFMEQQADVLITTTIIESGLDIPNANTIIIERADRFGLAELYQLRGRVGRWTRQSYAYLLMPRDNTITSLARERLSAIRRYTHLGAGFKLALRDLEIRGAGNLLGAEQSGYINMIGFDLYCQLLKNMIQQLQGKTVILPPQVDMNLNFIAFANVTHSQNKLTAAFPKEYIISERLRIEFYRRLSNCCTIADVDSLTRELTDRFGKMPQSAKNLLTVMKLQITAGNKNIINIKINDEKVLIKTLTGFYKQNGKIPRIITGQPPQKLLQFMCKLIDEI